MKSRFLIHSGTLILSDLGYLLISNGADYPLLKKRTEAAISSNQNRDEKSQSEASPEFNKALAREGQLSRPAVCSLKLGK